VTTPQNINCSDEQISNRYVANFFLPNRLYVEATVPYSAQLFPNTKTLSISKNFFYKPKLFP